MIMIMMVLTTIITVEFTVLTPNGDEGEHIDLAEQTGISNNSINMMMVLYVCVCVCVCMCVCVCVCVLDESFVNRDDVMIKIMMRTYNGNKNGDDNDNDDYHNDDNDKW